MALFLADRNDFSVRSEIDAGRTDGRTDGVRRTDGRRTDDGRKKFRRKNSDEKIPTKKFGRKNLDEKKEGKAVGKALGVPTKYFVFKNSENFRDQLAYVKRLSFLLLRSLFRLRAKFLKNGGEESLLGARPADRAVLFDAVASGERQSNARAFCAEGTEMFFSKNSENFRDQLAHEKRLSFVLLRSPFRLRAKF